MMDVKMLEKRIAILKEVNRLTSKCDCQSAKEAESCANCKKIQNYGKRLLKLVNKRTSVFGNELEHHERKERVRFDFTNEEYQSYKAEAKTDKEIAIIRNIDISTLLKWKKRNNIKVAK